MGSDCVTAYEPSLQLELDTTFGLCKAVDSPRSLAVSLLCEHAEWRQLVDLKCDPSSYTSASKFADDYLVTQVMQKSVNLPLAVDRKHEAWLSFQEAEIICGQTNARVEDGSFALDPKFRGKLEAMRSLIERWLGGWDDGEFSRDLTPSALRQITHMMHHGSGATTGVKGVGSVKSDKTDEPLHLTQALVPFARALLGDRIADYHFGDWEVVRGNRFDSVPKKSTTDRGICIEPTLNVFGQLGIGSYLKERLKLIGVNLYDQGINRMLVRHARDLGLCTIDLSMASDTLAALVVLYLLPLRWVELLSLFRSEETQAPDESWVKLEKFSSMGNGYTFELESLIFSAAVFVTVPEEEHVYCSIYGDDIICPRKYYDDVVDLLNHLGFRVNGTKSFRQGEFFESCGHDWFDNQEVRPFHLKGTVDSDDDGNPINVPYSVRIANKLRLYSRKRGGYGCDQRFKPLWISLKERSPSQWRKCRVPAHLGDVGFIDVPPRDVSRFRARDGHEGWYIPTMSAKPIQRKKRTFGRLMVGLRDIRGPVDFESQFQPHRRTFGREPMRGLLRQPKPKKIPVLHWDEDLNWVQLLTWG